MQVTDEIPRAEALRVLDVPQPDVGAPAPHVLADDHHLAMAFRVQAAAGDLSSDSEPCAVVVARPYHALRFGPPNDEALHGHRLYPLGLRPYAAFEIVNSAWIAEMEQANRVHARHRVEPYRALRHFAFTFHDSMVEIVAVELTVAHGTGALAHRVLQAFEEGRQRRGDAP